MEAKDIAKSAVVSLDKHKAADIKVIEMCIRDRGETPRRRMTL